ncbi:MAG: hypothetical protein ACKVHE_03690 [Planctomycetales bacterium]
MSKAFLLAKFVSALIGACYDVADMPQHFQHDGYYSARMSGLRCKH